MMPQIPKWLTKAWKAAQKKLWPDETPAAHVYRTNQVVVLLGPDHLKDTMAQVVDFPLKHQREQGRMLLGLVNYVTREPIGSRVYYASQLRPATRDERFDVKERHPMDFYSLLDEVVIEHDGRETTFQIVKQTADKTGVVLRNREVNEREQIIEIEVRRIGDILRMATFQDKQRKAWHGKAVGSGKTDPDSPPDEGDTSGPDVTDDEATKEESGRRTPYADGFTERGPGPDDMLH